VEECKCGRVVVKGLAFSLDFMVEFYCIKILNVIYCNWKNYPKKTWNLQQNKCN